MPAHHGDRSAASPARNDRGNAASPPGDDLAGDADGAPASAPAARPFSPYRSKAPSARPAPEPPSYVRPLSERGIEGLSWLDFGLLHRTRYELRSDDYRRPTLRQDDPFMPRTLGYIGVREVLDPLRLGFEFMDARMIDSEFPDTPSEVDEHEVLQAFAELFFEDALGEDQPLRFQVGRMTLDYMDRRLIERNSWSNAIKSYEGFRLRAGKQTSRWSVDVIAVRPVERRTVQFDRADEESWLYGLIGAWRAGSPTVQLEPYYLVLDQDRKRDRDDREIHTIGLRAFGKLGDTGLDYDLNNAFQFGRDGRRDHCAYAGWGEIGYTFAHAWDPRLALMAAYATGDRNPDDRKSERFDRLFGSSSAWSVTEYIRWENVILAKLRLTTSPLDSLDLEAAYGAYWLASDSDTFGATGRRDPTGRSGDWGGHELALSVSYEFTDWAELEAGYVYFMPGTMLENTGPADDSELFYVTVNLELP